MATKSKVQLGEKETQLMGQYTAAWDALTPLRETWDDKEKALLAKNADSVAGRSTRVRVTDAALSTLSFERQARVAAQLPTGKVYAASKADEGKAKLMNVVLQRYIIPNAGRGMDLLTLQRLWGVYASVYGSMPMFYDYTVEDDYIGPYATLVDPRNFLPQPGFNTVQGCDWVMISTVVSIKTLETIVKKKNTSYDVPSVKKVIEMAKKGKPSRDDDADKDSYTSTSRYRKDRAEGRIELVTKYEKGEKGKWITFAPDYAGTVIRDIPNPHKSGKIPVVMRHCFPLLNSIYGLGDYERGMKIQKAKDSLVSLFLEGAKMAVFPPKLINTSNVTLSSIKDEAGGRYYVTDMNNSVKAYEGGNARLNEFQATYSSLHTMLMNQFGTSDTTQNADQSANSTYGKTPQALKMLEQRENARDTWDRFMHEKAVEELYEGMLNLLTVKMEKPINFNLFSEEIRQIEQTHPDILEVTEDGKYGMATIAKRDVKSDKGYTYVIDANSSMRQDDEAQVQTLTQLLQLGLNPDVQMLLQQKGLEWDIAEHIKTIFTNSGVTDWERILKDVQSDPQAQDQAIEQQMAQEAAMQEQAQMNYQANMDQIRQEAQFQDPEIAALAEQMLGGQ